MTGKRRRIEEQLVVEPKFRVSRQMEELLDLLPDYASDCMEEYLRGNLPKVSKEQLYSLFDEYHKMPGLGYAMDNDLHDPHIPYCRHPLAADHTETDIESGIEDEQRSRECDISSVDARDGTIDTRRCDDRVDHGSNSSVMDECDTI